MEQIGFVYVKL